MATDVSPIGLAAHITAPTTTGALAPLEGGRQAAAAPLDLKQVPPPARASPPTTPSDGALARNGYARMQAAKDRHFEELVGMRDTRQQIERFEALLADMKTSVEAIVKQYPPYPPDNSDRVALVNKIMGLQKEIESLTATFPRKLDLPSGLGDKPAAAVTDLELGALLNEIQGAQSQTAEAGAGLWADIKASSNTGEIPQDAQSLSSASRAELAQSGRAIGVAARQLTALA